MPVLFDSQPREDDHRFYQNLASTDFRPDIREWCERAYERAGEMLDRDFPARFRRDTPHRVSELFFADAFLDAAWQPIGRTLGFDLAFRLEDSRLLVEVTTPDPPTPDNWETVERDGTTIMSSDEKSEDAALRRLTGGFASKARKIQVLKARGIVGEKDYVVVALSGLRLSQETPIAPEIGMPGFSKAFLPIGSQYVTFRLGGPDEGPAQGGYLFKDKIEQAGKADVDRNFFLRDDFRHIDAVAYSPLHLGGTLEPKRQCGALHNPMSGKASIKLGLGEEYAVEVGDQEFTVRRINQS